MFNQPLPLPGEQPRTIWQPRKRRTTPRGSIPWRLVAVLLSLGLVAGGAWLWLSGGTAVTVVVNGAPIDLRTHSADVAGAVQAAGVRLEDVAYVYPPLDAPLRPGLVVTTAERLPVIIHTDAGMQWVDTRRAAPEAILSQAGIRLGPGDAVRVDRALRPSQAEIAANPALAGFPSLPRELTIVHAATIIVAEGGSQVSFQTTAPTLGEALEEAGYTLYEGDAVSPPLDTAIPPGGLQVSISPTVAVTVQADGRTRATRTHQPTVGTFLSEIGLALSSHDYVKPNLDTPITEGLTVRLVRVQQVTQDERLPIPFQTTFVPDPDMQLDQQREIQPGRDGTQIRRSVIQLEDGIQVSQAVATEWVEAQPRARVVAYGTRIVIDTLQTADGNFKYWRKLRVLATSYSPSNASDKKPGDPRYGLSGTGAVVRRGVVAVDTRVISLGTRLYVPQYGVGTALDVGGAVKGLRIDLGYEDPLPRLWNEWTDLYLLLPIPPPDQIIWVIPSFTPQ